MRATYHLVCAALLLLVGWGVIAFGAPNTTQPNLSNMTLSQCILNAPIFGGATGSVPKCNVVHTTGDTTVVIASTTNVEATTTTLSGARAWTLPSASAYGAGNTLYIADVAGAINGANVITVTRAGSDTVNGGTTFTMSTQYQINGFVSDGVSKWATTPAGSGTGTVTSITAAGGLTGGTITSAGTIQTPGGHLNKFRNGTFSVWQRGTSALSAFTTLAIPCVSAADGWCVRQTGAAFTCVQDTGNNGAPFSLKCVGGTSNTDTTFTQRIESTDAYPLAGQTVTVQFQYKQDTGGAITPKISTCFASASDNFTTCTADLASTSLTSCATATWCTESYTLTVSASATNGYAVTFDCNTALTSSQHCWVSAADIRVTPNVSTGVNSTPPPPELRNTASELLACQRYFSTSFGNSTTPADGTANYVQALGMIYNTNSAAIGFIPFPVSMRTITPTIAFFSSNLVGSPTAGQWQYYNAGWANGSSISAAAKNANGFSIFLTIVGTTNNATYVGGGWTASSEL